MDEQETSEIKVCPELAFFAADGAAVPLKQLRIAVRMNGDRLAELRLIADLDPPAWRAVDAAEGFNSPAAVRGPIFGGHFDEGKTVEVEARLKDEHLPLLAAAQDVFDLGAALIDAPADGALRATESWLLLYAKQQAMPGLKTGMRTSWAN